MFFWHKNVFLLLLFPWKWPVQRLHWMCKSPRDNLTLKDCRFFVFGIKHLVCRNELTLCVHSLVARLFFTCGGENTLVNCLFNFCSVCQGVHSNQILSCKWCHLLWPKKARRLKRYAGDLMEPKNEQRRNARTSVNGQCVFLSLKTGSVKFLSFQMSIRLSQGFLWLTEASCFVNLCILAFRSSEKDDPCNKLFL